MSSLWAGGGGMEIALYCGWVPPEDASLAPAPGHTGLGRGCGAHLIALFDGFIVWVLRVQHRVAGGIHRRARWLCRRCQTDVSVPVRERASRVTQIFVTIVAAEHPARHIPSRTTMRASALSPGHSRVLSGPGSGRIARRARRSVPRTRCMTVTDPSFSSPIGGHVDGEPFSLGLRRDADQALILGEPLGRGAMGVVRAVTRKSDGCTFALKTIPKAGPQSLAGQTPTGEAMTIWERKVRDEVSLHFALGASLDIVTLHDGFEDEAGVHLLIDLCDGGDLLSGASVAHSTEDEDNAVVPKNDDDDDEFSTDSHPIHPTPPA